MIRKILTGVKNVGCHIGEYSTAYLGGTGGLVAAATIPQERNSGLSDILGIGGDLVGVGETMRYIGSGVDGPLQGIGHALSPSTYADAYESLSTLGGKLYRDSIEGKLSGDTAIYVSDMGNPLARALYNVVDNPDMAGAAFLTAMGVAATGKKVFELARLWNREKITEKARRGVANWCGNKVSKIKIKPSSKSEEETLPDAPPVENPFPPIKRI